MPISLVLPGYKYLGPGNSLNSGDPTNEVDEIAYRHDLEYSQAKTQDDILNSDFKAVQDFATSFRQQPSIGSALGATGLGLKNVVERYVGVIYPRNLPTEKRKADSTIDEDHSAKKSNTGSEQRGDSNEAASMSTMDIDDVASGGGGASDDGPHASTRGKRSAASGTSGSSSGKMSSGGSQLRGTAVLPRGLRQQPMRYTRTYRKEYLLRVQNEAIETKITTDALYTPARRYGVIRYPYHDLPVNMLAFYLSKSEIAELMTMTTARVKNTKVDVYNKTGCLNFETASSASSIGNNNIGIYMCCFANDLHKKRFGRYDETLQLSLIEDIFWGNPYLPSSATTNFSSSSIANCGAQYVRRTLKNRFSYYQSQATSAYSYNGKANYFQPNFPLFDIQPFIEKRVNVSMDEGLLMSYEYKPKNGLVAGQFSYAMDHYPTLGTAVFSHKSMPLLSKNPTLSLPNASMDYQNLVGVALNSTGAPNSNPQLMPFKNPTPDYYSSILIDDRMHAMTNNKTPGLTFGIEPLTSEVNGKWEPVKCFVDLYVQVELEMEIIQGVDYLNPNTSTIERPNYMFPEYALGSNLDNNLYQYREAFDVQPYPASAIPQFTMQTQVPLTTFPANSVSLHSTTGSATSKQTSIENKMKKDNTNVYNLLESEDVKNLLKEANQIRYYTRQQEKLAQEQQAKLASGAAGKK